VCDLETSRIGAPYIYNVRLLRVNDWSKACVHLCGEIINVPTFSVVVANSDLHSDGVSETLIIPDIRSILM